jgi:hypothetical protein
MVLTSRHRVAQLDHPTPVDEIGNGTGPTHGGTAHDQRVAPIQGIHQDLTLGLSEIHAQAEPQ